jgi:hypothetical protein
MTDGRAKRLRWAVAWTALLCALVASLAFTAGPAAAESGDSAEIRPLSEVGLTWPEITGPTSPEEYPIQMGELSPGMTMRQVGDQKVAVEYVESGIVSYTIESGLAHDAVGANVPTSLKLSEDEDGFVLTQIIHYRAGNPAAGGEPFAFPITPGEGWEGGLHIISGLIPGEPKPPAAEGASPAQSPPPNCKVPPLRGLNLWAAKSRLHAADCVAGKVYLSGGATAAEGKVVKQFRAAGVQLAAGAPVALKLAARRS